MTGRDVLGYAIGAMRGHRLRTALTLLGIAVGVAAVVLLTSLGQGARDFVAGEFRQLGTNLLIVLPGKTDTTGLVPLFGGTTHDLTLEDAEAIARRVPAARHVAPVAAGEALVRYRDRARRTTVMGATRELQVVRRAHLRIGRYLPAVDPDNAPRVCVLGADVYRELFDGNNPLGEFVRIGSERFRVIGVTTPRGVSLGLDLDQLVHVPVRHAMRLFDQTSLFRVLIEVRSHAEIEAARRTVLAVLRERHGREDVTILTQDAVLSTFGRILDMLTAALTGIGAVSLAVAGIGIMNVMLVAVSERTAEIGLLKALGATPFQVMALFLAEACVLSSAGGLVGLAAGAGLGAVLRQALAGVPISAPAWAVTSALGLSMVVGVAFGALPAVRAARMDPIRALRGS